MLDRVAGPFYPAKIRPYLTLGWITAFVLVILLFAGMQRTLLPHPPLLPIQIQMERILRSPFFFVPYDLVVLLVIWLLVRSRPQAEYLYLRALLYGMFLAGFLGGCLVALVPWRG
jgi:hypothetical protein